MLLDDLTDAISFFFSSTDTTICTGCCSILDNIVSHIFKQLSIKGNLSNYLPQIYSPFANHTQCSVAFPTKKMRRNAINPDNDMFLKVIEMHPEILQGILSTIINIVMFEDCKNQWSLSRPLLGLILLYEEYFRFVLPWLDIFRVTNRKHIINSNPYSRSLKDNIIRAQPLDKQQTIAHWFENLMENVERNLSMKNRDKYVYSTQIQLVLWIIYSCSMHLNVLGSVKICRSSAVMWTKR